MKNQPVHAPENHIEIEFKLWQFCFEIFESFFALCLFIVKHAIDSGVCVCLCVLNHQQLIVEIAQLYKLHLSIVFTYTQGTLMMC